MTISERRRNPFECKLSTSRDVVVDETKEDSPSQAIKSPQPSTKEISVSKSLQDASKKSEIPATTQKDKPA